MADAILYQTTTESKVYTFDFADVLPSTDSALSNIDASDSTIDAYNFTGTDVGSTILSFKTRTGKTLLVTIGSLVLGQEYTVKFLGEGATSGQKFEKQLKVIARNNLSGEF
jgi:hypothetical protein